MVGIRTLLPGFDLRTADLVGCQSLGRFDASLTKACRNMCLWVPLSVAKRTESVFRGHRGTAAGLHLCTLDPVRRHLCLMRCMPELRIPVLIRNPAPAILALH